MKTQDRTQPFVDKVVRLISQRHTVVDQTVIPAKQVGDMVYLYIKGVLTSKKKLVKQIEDLALTDDFRITIKAYQDLPGRPCIWFCLHTPDYVPMDESVSSE